MSFCAQKRALSKEMHQMQLVRRHYYRILYVLVVCIISQQTNYCLKCNTGLQAVLPLQVLNDTDCVYAVNITVGWLSVHTTRILYVLVVCIIFQQTNYWLECNTGLLAVLPVQVLNDTDYVYAVSITLEQLSVAYKNTVTLITPGVKKCGFLS